MFGRKCPEHFEKNKIDLNSNFFSDQLTSRKRAKIKYFAKRFVIKAK